MSDEPAPAEGGSAAAPEGEPKMVPADQVERMIAERVNKSKAQFKDYGELREKAEQLDKLQAERQTDVEKAVSRAEKAEAKARAESAQREDLVRQLQENTVRSEVFRTAATAEIGLDIDDVFRLIDHSSVSISDSGEVSGVAEAISKLAEKYPKRSAPGGFDGGPRQVPHEGSSSADFNARLRRQAGFA
jgi:thioester reductase-like protein